MKTPRMLFVAATILALVMALGIGPQGAPVALAATDTFTVNTVSDGNCTVFPIRLVTLRCAILRANASPAGDVKLINFAIPLGCTGGICKLILRQALPFLTANNTRIDGYTQPGAQPNSKDLHQAGGDNAIIKIWLDGGQVPGVNGLVVEGSNDTVRGLSITDFRRGVFSGTGGAAIVITGPQNPGFPPQLATRDVVAGNFVGVLPDGMHTGSNVAGVVLSGGLNQLGRQYASGESIGSPADADRNVISGNTSYGIQLNDSTDNQVRGNYIGTDRTGAVRAGNGTGIYMNGEGLDPPVVATPSGDTIGGAGNAANLISGNLGWGIYAAGVAGASPSKSNITARATTIRPYFTLIRFNRNAVILGNDIGTNLTGAGAIGNGLGGIFSHDGLHFTIGDTASPADGNLISGNGGDGIQLVDPGTGNTISGNTIGLSASGGLLANAGNGVELSGGGLNNASTRTDTVSHNIIAGNLKRGVQIGGANQDNTHVIVSQNSMYANQAGKLGGIGLFGQAPDQCIFGPFGGLSLANDYMGCPLIKSATPQTGITGEAPANSLVELFVAPNGVDDEGKTLLGTVSASSCPTLNQPDCWGTFTLAPGGFLLKLKPGMFVTATATSQAGTLASPFPAPSGTPFALQTSQFSRDVPVGQQLVVNTTADKTSPCPASAFSLRCAIDQANKDKAGDQIDFNIPAGDPRCAAGVCTLGVAGALPVVTADSTSLNGYTQPGAGADTNQLRSGSNARIDIHLVGTGVPTAGDGLVLQGSWDEVEGFSIQSFADPNAGAGIHASGPRAMWDMILGDWVGLDPSGAAGPSNLQNQQGVQIDGGAGHALVGFRALRDPNVLSGNQNYGLFNEESGHVCIPANPVIFTFCNNMVLGNFIGTDPTGTAARGNAISGLFFYGSDYNVIGAGGGQTGNLIGGNLSDGIDGIASNFNWIAANDIGNSLSGAATIPNGVSGIFLYGGKGNLVGGPGSFFLNAVGGNGGDGIDALAEPDITIAYNIIGSFHSDAGIQSEPNGGDGIFLGNTTSLATPELHKHRVPVSSAPSPRGPIVGYNTMQALVAHNVVVGNSLDGIQVGQASDDKDLHAVMSQNFTQSNGSAGIAFTGSTLNECHALPNDSPNDGLACPFITGASNNSLSMTITGFTCPGCLVEVFRSSNEHNGFGEGTNYLGSATANGSGFWQLNLNTPAVAVGEYVTATSTTPAGGALLPETSEFANNFQVTLSCTNNPNC